MCDIHLENSGVGDSVMLCDIHLENPGVGDCVMCDIHFGKSCCRSLTKSYVSLCELHLEIPGVENV